MFEALKSQGTSLLQFKPGVSILSAIIDRRIRNFVPLIETHHENSRFIVKTASSGNELRKILELRHDIYYRELLNCDHPLKLDVDKFDFKCDHLAVIDKASGCVVGTYRLNSSIFNDDFYSSTEFDISAIEKLDGVKLEIGRACVHPDFRNAITISMLWKGILEYSVRTGTKWLFGCSSVKTTDSETAVRLYKYFNIKPHGPDRVHVRPKKLFRVPDFEKYIEKYYFNSTEDKNIDGLVPPLLKFYIKSGAHICGEPALDREFKCIDFLTLLNLESVNSRIAKRFL